MMNMTTRRQDKNYGMEAAANSRVGVMGSCNNNIYCGSILKLVCDFLNVVCDGRFYLERFDRGIQEMWLAVLCNK